MRQVPYFLNEMLIKQYGEELKNRIIQGYARKKTTLRVNTIKSNKKEIEEILKKENIEFEEVAWNNDALIITNKENEIRNLDIYKTGKIYLQSLSSMLPVMILEPKPKENILDMAAAPGGKTTQIAAITENEAFITACEKNKIRLERLKYNLEKQGVKSTNVMQEDSRKLSDFFKFDKILLDAPCSGSGTENIFEEKFTEDLIKRIVKTQEELLTKALKLIKSSGEVVYSTCSVLKEENEKIIKKVIKNSNFEIIPIELPKEINILPTEIDGTVCVCPNELYEGFFIAKIRKN